MGKLSRNKGARGERLWRDICREHGFDASRTAQHSGKAGGMADVVGLPGIHCEVKNVERLNIWDAMEQSIRDSETAEEGEIPIVAHTKNYHGFLVTMRAEDFFRMYSEYWPMVAESREIFGVDDYDKEFWGESE